MSEERHQYKYNYSVCVSPLFGSVLAKRLVEFLELTRILGVQQVFFYDFHVSSVIHRVLSFYQDKVSRSLGVLRPVNQYGYIKAVPGHGPEMGYCDGIPHRWGG